VPARLCILGSINTDLVVRAPRLPAPGETLLGGPFWTSPGGKGANQAVAAARMGAGVSMIGAVGDDDHGRAMLGTLGAEGVDLTHVATRVGVPTGVALISVAEQGENTIIVAPGANATLTPADADAARDAIGGADVLLVQLEVPLETVARAAAIARNAGTAVILNAAPAHPLSADLLALIDVLVVNETEGAAIALRDPPGPGGLPRLAESLARLAPPTVVLTLGARGLWYSHARSAATLPAHSVHAVDTVGAGDAFCGVLATRWAEHRAAAHLDADGVRDALYWASAAGALATTRRGAIPSLARRSEVVALLKSAAAQPTNP